MPSGDRLTDSGSHRPIASATATLERPLARPAPSSGADLNPTGEMMIKLWGDTPDTELGESWRPDEALQPVPERSVARLASMVLMVMAVLAVVAAVSFILRSGVSAHDELSMRAVEVETALGAFDNTAASPDFGSIDRAARDMLETAQRLEVGDTSRAIAIDAAGRILDAERALSEAISYRTRFVAFVGRPALPTSTDTLDDVSAQYTAWFSSFDGVLAPVPDLESFDEHRELVSTFAERGPRIQARYLDALRAGDANAAAQALSDLDGLVTKLDSSVVAATNAARQAFGDATDEALSILSGLQNQP